MSREKIIVALDVETAAEAREIIMELRGEVGAFKIGLQLYTAAGADFIRELVSDDIKIFLDVKFHDIPNTVAKASAEAARLGVWMFNIHASGGGEMMRRAISEVAEVCAREGLKRPKIIGVTVLTSANRETLREVGIESEVSRQVSALAKLAEKCGLDGVVASPLEIEMIRQNIRRKNFLIVTPGIRSLAGSFKTESADDQKRVMTPAEAVRAGADYLVVGRPVLKSGNRRQAVKNILAEIEETAVSAN